MDWSDTPEHAAFRSEVRGFIGARLPERYTPSPGLPPADPGDVWLNDRASEEPAAREAAREWASALGEHGWVAAHWPIEYGGAGLGPVEQLIFGEEMAHAGAPRVGGLGVSLLGPTVIVHGTPEQQREIIPRILSGEVVWAQGYSEPGAGSDLASLQMSARADGDDYVVDGQKIWTTGGHLADGVFALVRTAPEAPKHRGISFIYLDIRTAGVQVRPILNLAGSHTFNEIFFEEVRVPQSQRLGEENRGWYVAMTLLDFERSGIGIVSGAQTAVRRLVAHAVRDDDAARRIRGSARLRHDIVDCWIAGEVAYNFSLNIASMQSAGRIPNYEASITKMFATELHQRTVNAALRAFGLYGGVIDPTTGPIASDVKAYMETLSLTIAGGTSEIQRNVIATRGLGLPRS